MTAPSLAPSRDLVPRRRERCGRTDAGLRRRQPEPRRRRRRPAAGGAARCAGTGGSRGAGRLPAAGRARAGPRATRAGDLHRRVRRHGRALCRARTAPRPGAPAHESCARSTARPRDLSQAHGPRAAAGDLAGRTRPAVSNWAKACRRSRSRPARPPGPDCWRCAAPPASSTPDPTLWNESGGSAAAPGSRCGRVRKSLTDQVN